MFKLLEDRNEEISKLMQLQAAVKEVESEKKKKKIEKKMAKLQAKLDKNQGKINKIKGKKGNEEGFNPVVCAFVMFNTQVAQLDCLRDYSQPSARIGGLFCRKQDPKYHLKIEGKEEEYPLKVHEAPEPSTLLWENLECGAKSRAVRRVLSSCCSFLIILISFGVIVAGKSYSLAMKGAEELCLTPGYTASCNEALNWKAEVEHACPDGRESCALWEAWNLDPYWRVQVTPMDLDDALYPPTTYTMIGHECRFIENNDGVFAVDKSTLDSSCTAAAAVNSSHWLALINAGWRDPFFPNKTDCVLCLCAALQTSQNILWLETWDFSFYSASLRSDDDKAFCTPQAEAFFTFVGLQGAAIVIVVLFNTVMKTTTQLLAVFERHHTLDDQETSVTFAVFIGQFINTALVAMIVYGNIPVVGKNVPDEFPILAGEFEDFNSGWYFLVGVQIMTTIIVNVIMPIVPLVLEVMFKMALPLTTKGTVLQSELNNAYLGSDFLLSTRYGMLLNSMFTCFMYSSGMPILLFIGVFIFFVTFWVDKIQLLRVSSSPPQYDARLAIYVVKKFKWAILIHMLIGCWVFSASDELGADLEGMFPRPVLSEGLENYSEDLVEEQFGCQNFKDQESCDWENKCVWAIKDGEDEERCLVDYTSDEYDDYANFDFVPRLFNRVVFPYFLFTFLFLIHTILQFTPARVPVNLATGALFGAIRTGVRMITRMVCGAKVEEDHGRPEGDHGMQPYKVAVEDGAFGTFDYNYDVTLIGQYEKTLSVGDSLSVYRQVSPYEPLLDVQPPPMNKSRAASPEPT